MILGLLPAIRGGLGELAKSGQHTRLIDHYFRPYARAFDEVRYFSYLAESLERYAADANLAERVRLVPGGGLHPWFYAFVMPARHRRLLRGCAVLRVFQMTGVIPAVLARRWFGVPFVTTYGFWYAKLARTALTRVLRVLVERVGLREAAAVMVTTPELAAHVSALVDAAKVHLVPNGVDTTVFRPTAGVPGRARRVLYVGRLSQEKSPDTLVEAAAKLRGRFDIGLTVVGDGPLRDEVVARAGALDVPLELIPVVAHREMPRIFAGAGVFVLPSRTEGHAKVLIEAMSAGLACVASDVGGNRSLLGEEDAGLLFEPGDAASLAGQLERVLGEPALARRLGERARRRVVEHYDLGQLVAREIELLQRVARSDR